jgi:ATP-dependent DNA helicase RecG
MEVTDVAELKTDVRFLKGVGEKRAQALARLGVTDLASLLSLFPRRYEDRRKSVPIAEAEPDRDCCICAMVAAEPHLHRVRRGMELVKVSVVDDTGKAELTFFNQSYLRSALTVGRLFRFYGKIGGTARRRTMVNPVFEDAEAPGLITGRIVPVYPLTAGLNQGFMLKTMLLALEACGDDFPDYLPAAVAEGHALCRAKYAYHNIHFPESPEALELARRRLIFEELFVLACALKRMGREKRRRAGAVIDCGDAETFYAALPFRPTRAQARAVDEVFADLHSGTAMNRLVQGDVGSGKTMVAAACIRAVCAAGHQAALMAPTEILARQHYETMHTFLEPFGVRICLLTGSMKAKERRAALEEIRSGEAQLIIGTHALISQEVDYADLALVVTDEQHRFGVRQRGALSDKAAAPHVLVMSATPIPRTLALMIYGDLDVSVIDELPPGRQKVGTFAVGSAYRARLNAFIEKLVAQGRQVFVVCPRIEDEETGMEGLLSAEEHAAYLAGALRDVRVQCVHGRMKAKEKDAAMDAFVRGETDVLVSTTVIEVGVDVPNAALMIVENAERFGLSQLHQLRGRVGRGKHKSYCVLVSDAKGEEARARLDALCKISDGFHLAEEDLRQRGPGDFFGARQHGLPEMHVADLGADMRLLQDAQAAAEALLEADPLLRSPDNAALLARLEALFDLNQGAMN